MKHGKCVGCNKSLKAGEFVVMNGGAMVKTKTGATMGDKNLLGFLTINNHFDSKKNYRTMVVTDIAPNGQFEFYACSHKCLIDFLTRMITCLSVWDKGNIKIEKAPQAMMDKVGYDWGLKVVKLLGVKRALITDESTVGDFLDITEDEFRNQIIVERSSKRLGFKVKASDYIWKIAQKYKNRRTVKEVIWKKA